MIVFYWKYHLYRIIVITRRIGQRVAASALRRGSCAEQRDDRQRRRDQRVVAGERHAEEAPRGLIAARDVDVLQAVEKTAGAAEFRRAGALGRTKPQFPFNARMEDAHI